MKEIKVPMRKTGKKGVEPPYNRVHAQTDHCAPSERADPVRLGPIDRLAGPGEGRRPTTHRPRACPASNVRAPVVPSAHRPARPRTTAAPVNRWQVTIPAAAKCSSAPVFFSCSARISVNFTGGIVQPFRAQVISHGRRHLDDEGSLLGLKATDAGGSAA